MNTLAIDTALGACSVAVLAGDKVLAHRFELMERGHAEALAPMVEHAMSEARVSFAELDRLAVTTGPGTFTGQRVGLAFMRGLRLALERPLIGVTSLEAMAHQAMEETGLTSAAAVHDARDDEVYFQFCGRASSSVPMLLSLSAAAERIVGSSEVTVLAGGGSQRLLKSGLINEQRVTRSAIVVPDALWVARLANSRTATTEIPKPLYLRPPAARLPGPVK